MKNYDDCKKQYDANGGIQQEEYFLNGKRHRLDGPAYINYYHSGEIFRELYYLNGKRHRINGPYHIWYYQNGETEYECYALNDKQIYVYFNVRKMYASNNKTQTLLTILNETDESKNAVATILINMFRNDIDQAVINNLEIFL